MSRLVANFTGVRQPQVSAFDKFYTWAFIGGASWCVVFVRADAISPMYRRTGGEPDYTMLHYTAQQGGHWAVKETPEEILALIQEAL